MKNLKSFDEFLNEGFTKYDSNSLSDTDLKDKSTVTSFIELHNINKLFIDIWEYMKKNYNLYPNKIVAGDGCTYKVNNGRYIEMEFKKNGKIYLYLFPGISLSDRIVRPNMSGEFSFKLLSDMMLY